MDKFMGKSKGQKAVATMEKLNRVNTPALFQKEANRKEIAAMTTGTLAQLM